MNTGNPEGGMNDAEFGMEVLQGLAGQMEVDADDLLTMISNRLDEQDAYITSAGFGMGIIPEVPGEIGRSRKCIDRFFSLLKQ